MLNELALAYYTSVLKLYSTRYPALTKKEMHQQMLYYDCVLAQFLNKKKTCITITSWGQFHHTKTVN